MERTFAIIKPDAVAANQAGDIIAIAQKAGFRDGEAEAFLADPRPRIDVDAGTQQSVAEAGVSADAAVSAKRRTFWG